MFIIVYLFCTLCWFCLFLQQAIDSFGNRYLLGVFENKDDAKKAFDAWNKEYEQVPNTKFKWWWKLRVAFWSFFLRISQEFSEDFSEVFENFSEVLFNICLR